jgi:pimeloyl-ACP methyl ester carboxylesterase
VRQVLERVEREPVVVEMPSTGGRESLLAIGKWDLQYLTADAMGRTRTARKLPLLYYTMSQGDFSRVAPLVRAMRSESLPAAMSYLMDCASGASAARLARIEHESTNCLLGNAANFPFPAINAAWGAPDLGEEFRAPLRSDVRALLISGSLDGRTPPANAEEVLQGFSRGVHLIIEGAGHDDDLFCVSDEMRRRVVAFVKDDSISIEPIKVERPRLEWLGRP